VDSRGDYHVSTNVIEKFKKKREKKENKIMFKNIILRGFLSRISTFHVVCFGLPKICL